MRKIKKTKWETGMMFKLSRGCKKQRKRDGKEGWRERMKDGRKTENTERSEHQRKKLSKADGINNGGEG